MKNFNYCLLTLLILAGISCKKKEYPVSITEGAPVFNCGMTVNGAPVSFTAGVNNYYMYSSYQQDSNNVYGFIAGLKQANCSSCPNSLLIQINDFKVSAPNAPVIIDSALTVGNYNYLASTSSAFYTTQFQSSYNKTAAAYFWDFGDGSTSGLQNPTHIYKKNKNYNVNLTVQGTNGCVSSVSNVQNIGISNAGFRVYISDSGAVNTINFNSNISSTPSPLLYLWNFGDGTPFATSASPVHTYHYPGSYPVTLRVINGIGDTAYAKTNVVTANDVSSCVANYTVANVNQTPNTLGLSNIIINWTDANGVVYTSKNLLQPANSYFTIVSVQNYQNNEFGQPTKKIHVKFRCTVYNGSNSILIDNADAIITVAYK